MTPNMPVIKGPVKLECRVCNPGNELAWIYADSVRVAGPMDPSLGQEIVHRYNSHQAMREALERLAGRLDTVEDLNVADTIELLGWCRKALALGDQK